MPQKKEKTLIPEIKKKISSYLTSEDGKITKESLLTIGAFVTSAAASAALLSKAVSAGHTNVTSPQHGNDVTVKYYDQQGVASGSHTHHASSTHSNVHGNY